MSKLLVGVVLLAFSASLSAAETGFLEKTWKSPKGEAIPYVVFVPHGYKKDAPTPTILFLHGSGETKGGAKKPVEVGLGTAIKAREKTFPFLTIIPQSQKRTWKADSDDGKMAMAILEEVSKEYSVDPKRTYLLGLSMGGSGTWSLAAAYPDKWAAISPICSGGEVAIVDKIKHLPCWYFVGDQDSANTVKKSREIIEALRKAGAKVKYTEYPGVGHNSWDKAYATDELYTWLAEQVKK